MPKKSLINDIPKKRLVKATAKKVGTNKSNVRRVLKAFDKVAAEMAADRPAHFMRFIDTWRTAVLNVDALADALMQCPQLVIPEDAMKLMLLPYSLQSCLLYRSLAGELTYAEELELVETAKALDNAWNKLATVFQVRPNVTAQDVECLRHAVENLNQRVLDAYQGSASSELDVKWVTAYDNAQKSLKRMAEGLAS